MSAAEELIRRRALPGCATDAHRAFTVVDRNGVWFWACRHCPATREQTTPEEAARWA